MYIKYTKGNRNYHLEFDYPLNLIIGDSSTGKTDFIQQVIKNRKYATTDASKLYINPIGIDYTTIAYNSMVLIDSDSVLLEDISGISSCGRDDVCFIIFGRKYAKNLPFSVLNTFQLINSNKTIINSRMFEPNSYKLGRFSTVMVEDEKSGFLFFKSVFHNTKTIGGNGNISKHIKSNNLLVLDSVGFGGYIENFMKKVNNKDTPYILYNSFEGFLLREKFGIVDIPKCINIEDGLLRELKNYIPDYSKKRGCTGASCSSCKSGCKTSSKQLFESSEYSMFLGYQDNTFSSAISKMG